MSIYIHPLEELILSHEDTPGTQHIDWRKELLKDRGAIKVPLQDLVIKDLTLKAYKS